MKIELEVPDQYLAGEDPERVAKRITLYAALVMLQSGELSAGAAAELAGVSRYELVLECARRGVPIDADRAALHEALRQSDLDVAEGRLVDAEQVLRELRSG